MKGLIIKSTGSFYDILGEDGQTYKGRARGKLRLKGFRTTNPIAVGDRVEFSLKDDGTAVIEKILPRQNALLRRATNLSKKYHLLASNIDQVFVLYTPHTPETLLSFLDRVLVSAEAYGIPPVLLINKMDLYEKDPEAMAKIEAFKRIYAPTEYPVLEVSARTGYNLDKLRAMMKDKISAFAGNSGTGKSSLVNALIPGLNLKTGDVSEVHRQGRHTTTFAQLHRLPEGGYIIDTPGIRAFGTIDIEPRELDNYFPELRRYKPECKFNDCYHVNEPSCSVKEHLHMGDIAPERYRSYLDILDELKNPDGPYRLKKY
jgi:ribosome biogenesis GTPase